MKERKFIKILRKLKPEKFKTLVGSFEQKLEILYWNLWGQFGITPTYVTRYIKSGKPKPSVSDYAWTDEVKKAFYDHPKHQKFWKALDKCYGMARGMWTLNSEPADYDEYIKYVRMDTKIPQGSASDDTPGTGRRRGHEHQHHKKLRVQRSKTETVASYYAF